MACFNNNVRSKTSQKEAFIQGWLNWIISLHIIYCTEKCHRVAKYTRQVKKVGKGAHEPKAQTAGAYPGFISKKHLGVLLLPPGQDASPSQG